MAQKREQADLHCWSRVNACFTGLCACLCLSPGSKERGFVFIVSELTEIYIGGGFLFICLFVCLMLRFEPRASHMPSPAQNPDIVSPHGNLSQQQNFGKLVPWKTIAVKTGSAW